MEKTIKEITEKLKNNSITPEEAHKILLSLFDVIGMFTQEDMLDYATDQRNRDLEPTENTLKDWVNYR